MMHTWPEGGGDLGNSIKGDPEDTERGNKKDEYLEGRHATDRHESRGDLSLESITLVHQFNIE